MTLVAITPPEFDVEFDLAYATPRNFTGKPVYGRAAAFLHPDPFAAIFVRVQGMVFGETTARRLPHPPSALPVFVHLALVLLLGLYIPPYLANWYRQAAAMLG